MSGLNFIFFKIRNHVLQISDSIEDGGGLVPHLTVCLLVMWIVIYFCVWRGVKWSGKVGNREIKLQFCNIFSFEMLSTLELSSYYILSA